jgi:hypothetical protein
MEGQIQAKVKQLDVASEVSDGMKAENRNKKPLTASQVKSCSFHSLPWTNLFNVSLRQIRLFAAGGTCFQLCDWAG